MSAPCTKCNGCGRVANTPDQEPWSVWENIPVKAAIAIIVGVVKPITCPRCNGTKIEPDQKSMATPSQSVPANVPHGTPELDKSVRRPFELAVQRLRDAELAANAHALEQLDRTDSPEGVAKDALEARRAANEYALAAKVLEEAVVDLNELTVRCSSALTA